MKLSKDIKDDLIYLLDDYRSTREQYIEMTKDMETSRDTLVNFFNQHNIKEFLHKGKKYVVYETIYYTYPASCKKHKATEVVITQRLKMLDKKQKRSTPYRTMFTIKKHYNNQ